MKKAWKKFMSLLMILGVFMAISVMAEAKEIKNDDTVIYYQKEFDKTHYIADAEGSVTALKSSNPAVATVFSRAQEEDRYAIILTAKKPGTTTITYTSGENTYTQKVTIKKYQNVMKKITVNGKNITSKFKKKAVYTLSYKKYKNKTVKLKVAGKGSWGMHHGDYCAKSGKILKCMVGKEVKFKVTQKNSYMAFSVDNIKDNGYVSYIIVFK